MKNIISLTFLAGWAIACGNSEMPAGSAVAEAKAPQKREINGEKIFRQYCVTCHGVRGDMGIGGAANLGISPLAVEERALVITNGRNNMAAFSDLLSEEKIRAVAEYTMELTKAYQ